MAAPKYSVSTDTLPVAGSNTRTREAPNRRELRRGNTNRNNAGVVSRDSFSDDDDDDDGSADYSEVMHEGCNSPDKVPKLASLQSRDIDALVGIANSSPGQARPIQPQAPQTRPQAISEGGAEGEVSAQQLDVEVYLRAEGILATRGTKTDSFIRITLVQENLTEHEIGRTETQQDTLDPEFKHPVQLRFRLDDDVHLIRIELCDPGEGEADDKKVIVLGAVEMSLQDLVKMLLGGTNWDGSTVEPSRVSKMELQPLAMLQGKRANRNRQSRASRTSIDGMDDGLKSHGLGKVVLVPEIIATDNHFCWFVISASGLRTEKLSLPPSPYLKIFRMLADGTKAPVYETGHVRNVRDCAWKTVPIPLQRLHNGDPLRMIIIEVWDYGDVANSRIFGYARLPASQLLQGAEVIGQHGAPQLRPEDVDIGKRRVMNTAQNIPLQKPSLRDRRGSMTATIVGFGRASNPGALQILRAEIDYDEAEAVTVFKKFDVEGVRREAHLLAPPEWTTLSERYDKVVLERQLGLRSVDFMAFFKGCASKTKSREQWLESTRASRFAKKYNPFHYAYLSIGSRFGSGIQALFGFALTLIQLNTLLAAFWLIFVNIPQILLNDLAIEVHNDINATVSTAQIHADQRPALLYFGGYDPVYYHDDGSVVYQMDVAYFLTSMLGTVGVSLLWLVISISRMISVDQDNQFTGETGGKSQRADLVELVFCGWDMVETTKRAATQMREHIATHLKQQILQLEIVGKKQQVKSAKQVRDLMIRRIIMRLFSLAVLVGSLACVVLILQPSVEREIIELISGTAAGDTIAEILPSIVITLVNTVAPMLIKIFVRLERWSNPEVELRQAIIMTFLIKMLNLVFTAIQLDNPADLPAANEYSEENYMGGSSQLGQGCQESAAGKTYVQLIFTDLILSAFLASVPKFFFYKCKVKPFGFKMIIDLPKEVMELIYRQALLWVGALYSPLIFPIGLISHVTLYFIKYVSFRYLYKAPEKPFSRTNVTRLFLNATFASLLAMIIPYSYAITQSANPYCGPLRDPACGKLPYNESGQCGVTRFNYEPVLNALMSNDQVDLFNITAYGEGSSILTQLASCDVGCVTATIIASLFSVPVLLLTLLLTCIVLNLNRARLRRLQREQKHSAQLLQEEHSDKLKLLRFNGVQL